VRGKGPCLWAGFRGSRKLQVESPWTYCCLFTRRGASYGRVHKVLEGVKMFNACNSRVSGRCVICYAVLFDQKNQLCNHAFSFTDSGNQ
jgi:hypothetical protein